MSLSDLSDLSDLADTSSEEEEEEDGSDFEYQPNTRSTRAATKAQEKPKKKLLAPRPPRTVQYSSVSLHDMLHQGTINLDPEYQRGEFLFYKIRGLASMARPGRHQVPKHDGLSWREGLPRGMSDVVWTETKQSGLIDSLIHNYYIPPIVFAVGYQDDGTETRVCIDGKQRLTSIQQFMDGQLPQKDSFNGKRYWYKRQSTRQSRTILPENLKKIFNNKQIVCVEYEGLTEDQEREIFQRVQLGVALTPAERMGTLTGPWPSLIREAQQLLASHSFDERLQWDSSRNRAFSCFTYMAWYMFRSGSRPTGISGMKTPSISQFESWMVSTKPADILTPAFHEEYMRMIRIFIHMAMDDKLSAPLRATRDQPKLSPVELTVVGILIHVHGAKMSVTQLSNAVREMRKDVRGAIAEVRLNGKVMKRMIGFVAVEVGRLGRKVLGTDGKGDRPAKVVFAEAGPTVSSPSKSGKTRVNAVVVTASPSQKRKRRVLTSDDDDPDGDSEAEAEEDDEDDDHLGRPRYTGTASRANAGTSHRPNATQATGITLKIPKLKSKPKASASASKPPPPPPTIRKPSITVGGTSKSAAQTAKPSIAPKKRKIVEASSVSVPPPSPENHQSKKSTTSKRPRSPPIDVDAWVPPTPKAPQRTNPRESMVRVKEEPIPDSPLLSQSNTPSRSRLSALHQAKLQSTPTPTIPSASSSRGSVDKPAPLVAQPLPDAPVQQQPQVINDPHATLMRILANLPPEQIAAALANSAQTHPAQPQQQPLVPHTAPAVAEALPTATSPTTTPPPTYTQQPLMPIPTVPVAHPPPGPASTSRSSSTTAVIAAAYGNDDGSTRNSAASTSHSMYVKAEPQSPTMAPYELPRSDSGYRGRDEWERDRGRDTDRDRDHRHRSRSRERDSERYGNSNSSRGWDRDWESDRYGWRDNGYQNSRRTRRSFGWNKSRDSTASWGKP